jgi:uncharacterized damage-inducible protein DinB
MKRLSLFVPCLVLAPITLACAQEQAPPPEAAAGPAQESHAAVGSIAPLFEMVKGYIIAAAEQMPEEKYTYRPNAEVRTFGQIVGHVAMTQYWFCNGATGQGQEPENYEELTSKAEMVQAVRAAFDYCAGAYAMSDTMAMEEVELWGETGTRLWVLSYNVAHAWEHYGNLVTYMRANGMVPPSSQGGM